MLVISFLSFRNYNEDDFKSQIKPKPSEELKGFLPLKDFNDTNLSKSERIFFIESSGVKLGSSDIGDLKERASCSIESAALLNPDSIIYVIFVSRIKLNISETVKSIMNYKNVELCRINLRDFIQGSIAESWIESDKLYDSSFLGNNISNFLRLFLLLKYGGTYLDTDVISKASINSIEENNFIGVESFDEQHNTSLINNAIMRFESMSIGHELVEKFLSEFMTNYNGHAWAWNGPHLVTQVINKFCDLPRKPINEKYNCSGVTILPTKMCSEISFREIGVLFSEDSSVYEKTLERIKDSSLVHLFNRMSQGHKVRTNSKTAIIEMAKQYCPIVLSNSVLQASFLQLFQQILRKNVQ
ncbi:CLUMA_CG008103, isoform A [Clunio marinus]|uniref:CLUMA_CG008103, isoform A n=1 Tax=Clunio marinus TaxID=568069 RepID=A0A1J1I329_9DIPT|nr:CLUMA_CG008103, isoform A [Clunio marinus]